jgi:hypothetical protein
MRSTRKPFFFQAWLSFYHLTIGIVGNPHRRQVANPASGLHGLWLPWPVLRGEVIAPLRCHQRWIHFFFCTWTWTWTWTWTGPCSSGEKFSRALALTSEAQHGAGGEDASVDANGSSYDLSTKLLHILRDTQLRATSHVQGFRCRNCCQFDGWGAKSSSQTSRLVLVVQVTASTWLRAPSLVNVRDVFW